MISDADLLNWTKADDADTALLRTLERAAVAAVQEQTGKYFGIEGEIVDVRYWRGGPIELSAEPNEDGVVIEDWTGSAWETVDSDAYYAQGAFLHPTGGNWPATRRIRLTYTAGYTVDAEDSDVWDAPEDIKVAVLLWVTSLYENREAVVVGSIVNEIPYGVDMLLRAHKRVAI